MFTLLVVLGLAAANVSNSLDPEETPVIGVSSGSKLFAYGIMISGQGSEGSNILHANANPVQLAVQEVSNPGRPVFLGNTARIVTQSAGPSARIVGGTLAEKSEWPWQVSLQYQSGSSWYHFCGGSLIANEWVLTAAHCLEGMGGRTLRVAIGDYMLDRNSFTEQHITPSNLYYHGDYDGNANGIPNDIGLVKLSEPAVYNEHAQAVPYASSTATFSSSDNCFISGWGLLSATGSTANTLKKTDMQVMTNNACRRTWGSSILSSHICINDNDDDSSACMGDSGGPLVCQKNGDWVLAGLTSWGSSDCATHLPNIYTRISSFTDWVDYVMANY